MQFTLGKQTFHHNVAILDDLKSDVIVGADLMREHNIVLDMGKRQIITRPRDLTTGRTKEADETEAGIAAYGYAKKNLTLEALQASILEIEAPRGSHFGQRYVVSGLHVPQGLVDTDINGKHRILVANKNLLPIQIRRGDRICSLEAVEEDDVIKNNKEFIKRAEERLSQFYGDGRIKETSFNTKIELSEKEINESVSEVPMEYKNKFTSLIRKFKDVFSSDPDTVGRCDPGPGYRQKIVLKDPNRVAALKPYRVAPNLTHVVESYVLKLLKQGVIEHSVSAWNSPLLLVRKPGAPKDGNEINPMKIYRIVHDFRLLNGNTVPVKYPLNSIFDLVHSVASGNVLSIIDLSSGYWSQFLEESSRPYTAFSVPTLGHFQYIRCAQGLINSSPYFQKLVNFVISGVPDTHCYCDDVIVSSKDMTSHLKALELLFERFRQHGLKCRVSKLKFGAKSVTYLGWKITANSNIQPGELKTKAIRDYKMPRTQTEIKSYLGLTNFFRKCVPFFSHIAKPLTELTKKNSTWKEGTELPADAKIAFERLKKILTTKPCLKPIDFNKTFYITIDSSNYGIGCVISQKHKHPVHGEIEYPNLYLSKTNKQCSSKRSAFDIESQGIIWCMRQLAPLVAGSQIVIRSDHRPIIPVNTRSTPMLNRLYAELQDFNFTMEFLPGQNMISDGLSRQDDHKECLLCNGQKSNEISTISNYTWAEMKTKLDSDKLHEGQMDSNGPRATSRQRWLLDLSETVSHVPKEHERIINISDEQIINMQKQDYFIRALLCNIKYNLLPDKPEMRQWVLENRKTAFIQNGIVCRSLNNRFQIFAPLNLRSTLLNLAHDHPFGGHSGFAKTFQRLQSWTWPNMLLEVKQYCQTCVKCQQNNPPAGGQTKMPLQRLQPISKFGDRAHADLLGPLPVSGQMQYKYCLVVTDAFSGFTKIIPIQNKEGSTVAKAILSEWISHFGIPISMTLDQGSEFTSEVFRNLCIWLGIKLTYSSIEHPMSNGMSERRMRNILSYVRKFIDGNPSNWSIFLNSLMSALNTSIHSDKLRSPFELVFGFPPVTSTNYHAARRYNYGDGGFDQMIFNHFKLQQEAWANQEKAFLQHKKQYDKQVKNHTFKVNDIVYLRAPSRQMKLFPRHIGPLKIVALRPNCNAHLQHLESGKSYFSHFNRLKLGQHRQQIVHSTKTQQEPCAADADSDVTKQVPSAIRDRELSHAVAIREPVMELPPSQLHNDLQRNLVSRDDEQGVAEGDADMESDGESDAEPPELEDLQPSDVTSSQSPFKGPMTRARRRLMQDSEFDKMFSVIARWQNLKSRKEF